MVDKSNTANQIVSVQNGMNHIDNLISLRIFKTIETLTQNLNIKSIVFLIFLLGIDSVKSLVKKSIDEFLEKIQNINFRFLLSKMFYKNEKVVEATTPKNTLNISYAPKNVFWEALGKLLNEEKVEYEIKSHQIIQKSKTEYTLIQKVEHFTINCENFSCYVGDLELEFQCVENDKKFTLAKNTKKLFDKSKSLLDNLPFPNFVEAIKKSTIRKNVSEGGAYSIDGHSPHSQIADEYSIYDGSPSRVSADFLPILFADRTESYFNIKNSTTIFGVNLKKCKITLSCGYSWNSIPDADKVRAWVDNQLNSAVGLYDLDLSLTSKNSSVDLLSEWTKFVDMLQKDCSMKEIFSKVNIYDLKIDTKIETETIFESEEGDADKKEKNKNVKKDIKIKSIKETVVNSIWKDFDTLYLKENDFFILNNTLRRFKNKKEIYTHLSIPYKFGALLYGEPGTGKSSCINAIASYLQKDIYYLDLTTVETNDDLKTLFNHINQNKKENGIVVIEDIDAMTDIVKKRTPGREQNELTLECLLNLLQGTLTHEGTTFIVTTNHIETLDPAFYRDGRFDIKIELTACDHYQMNSIYKKFFERTIPVDILKKIPEYTITPATFIQNLLPFILSECTDLEILKNMMTL